MTPQQIIRIRFRLSKTVARETLQSRKDSVSQKINFFQISNRLK